MIVDPAIRGNAIIVCTGVFRRGAFIGSIDQSGHRREAQTNFRETVVRPDETYRAKFDGGSFDEIFASAVERVAFMVGELDLRMDEVVRVLGASDNLAVGNPHLP